jgi:phosphatidylcholine synthase
MTVLGNQVQRARVKAGLAWTVHLYTALGNIAGFMALIAVTDGRVREVFLYMAAAIFIDSTDGPLARAFEVSRWTPTFDGRKLDDITDYLTYVVIPMFFAYRFQLVPADWMPVIGLVLLASAFGFCQDWAKTEDGFFTGFPSYWNVVVFYMYVLGTTPELNAVLLAGLAVLVFVPLRYVYPTKTKFLRPLTLVLGAVWALALLWVMINFEAPNLTIAWLSLLYPLYYFGLSFYLHFNRPRAAKG